MNAERELICTDIKPHACCDCQRCRDFMVSLERGPAPLGDRSRPNRAERIHQALIDAREYLAATCRPGNIDDRCLRETLDAAIEDAADMLPERAS